MTLFDDEIGALRDYFKNKHQSTEIGELDFIALINMKFEKVFDDIEAKRTLGLIKQRVYMTQGRTAMMICNEYDVEGLHKLTLRNFKHALHSLRLLTQFQIDNLAKYMDTENDGYVSIDKFDVEIRGAVISGATTSALSRSGSGSLGTSMVSGKRKQKWN